jgi:hypothetical protein
MRYAYLIASLPSLRFGEPPPLSSARFLEMLAPWAGTADYTAIAGVTLQEPFAEPDRHPVARAWRRFEIALRNTLAVARCRTTGGEPRDHLRPAPDMDTGRHIPLADVLNAPDPLEAERRLSFLRWRVLDEFEGEFPSDTGFLIAYRVRLLLLERLASFDAAVGAQRIATVESTAATPPR